MASLGVLSKTNREAAIRLLEQSLDFKFPDKVEDEIYTLNTKAMAEVEEEYNEAMQKEHDYLEHIKEMEEMGYDMTAYKNEEPIGGANARATQIGRASLGKECRSRWSPYH